MDQALFISEGLEGEIGLKWMIKGFQAVSISHVLKQCPLHLLLSRRLGEGPAGMSSWGACAPGVNFEGDLYMPSQGALWGPEEAPCRWGSLHHLPWSLGSFLRQTPLAAAYVPPSVPPPWGFPACGRKHPMPEHLSQKHVSEGSLKEKNLLMWITAASCVLQTTFVRMPLVQVSCRNKPNASPKVRESCARLDPVYNRPHPSKQILLWQ